MRTLAITENITLDGSIEMLKDWFDPQSQGDTASATCSRNSSDRAMSPTHCWSAGGHSRRSASTGRGRPTTRRASPTTSTRCRSTSCPRRSPTQRGRNRPCCRVIQSRR